jgi:outer membrane protein assembly factor BamB
VTEAGPPPEPEEGPCWNEFGGNPQRTLAREDIDLGRPGKALWARGMGSYLEYPPSFCDGTLYINTNEGLTMALDADTGAILWRRQGGVHASTPAIAGSRLIVSSHDGSVTALDRATGKPLWKLQTEAKIESSPVAIDDTTYFGSTDGRLFALDVATGEVRWAYDTGGRINSSPSVWGNRICISTYAGSIFCLDRRDGSKLWSTYIRRDALQYESFYASASTDGERLYSMARTGKVVALDAETGEVLWTQHVNALGYSTPAIAHGMVFVGGYDGALHAYRATTGELVWESSVGNRVLAPALVVGDLVFFSTLTHTYGARVADGKVVWTYNVGKYAPGIATDRRYYFSLNGLLVAFPGRAGGA